MKLLTIIIPAYNVENYLEECVGSILKSKFIEDIEILIINDGSTDSTLEKARNCAVNYPRSITVIDKKNAGHGSGINLGIEIASGKYLKVLDSDDWVIADGLDELIQFIKKEKTEPDAIINPYSQIWSDKKLRYDYSNLPDHLLFSFKELNKYDYRFTIHSLTIKTTIYKQYVDSKIDEYVSYDDVEYVLYTVPFISSIIFIKNELYQYRMGGQSQSVNAKTMLRKRNQLLMIISNCWHYYKKHESSMSNEQKEYFKKDLGYSVGDYLNLLFSINNRDEAYQEFKSFYSSCEFPTRYIRNKKAKLVINTRLLLFDAVYKWYSKNSGNRINDSK